MLKIQKCELIIIDVVSCGQENKINESIRIVNIIFNKKKINF